MGNPQAENRLDLDGLEKVAREATPGEWGAVSRYVGVASGGGFIAECRNFPGDSKVAMAEANARHIATFDPPTVLALLSQARLLKERTRERDEAMREADHQRRCAQEWFDRELSAERLLEEVVGAAEELRDAAVMVGYAMGELKSRPTKQHLNQWSASLHGPSRRVREIIARIEDEALAKAKSAAGAAEPQR